MFAGIDGRRRCAFGPCEDSDAERHVLARLVEAAKRSVGQHHGSVHEMQARHICQHLDLWRRRLKQIESDIEGLFDAHEVGRLLTTIDGIGPRSAARIIATAEDPARFRSTGAFADHVGVVQGLRQSGRRTAARAATAFGNAKLRRALRMTVRPAGGIARRPALSPSDRPRSRP